MVATSPAATVPATTASTVHTTTTTTTETTTTVFPLADYQAQLTGCTDAFPESDASCSDLQTLSDCINTVLNGARTLCSSCSASTDLRLTSLSPFLPT